MFPVALTERIELFFLKIGPTWPMGLGETTVASLPKNFESALEVQVNLRHSSHLKTSIYGAELPWAEVST